MARSFWSWLFPFGRSGTSKVKFELKLKGVEYSNLHHFEGPKGAFCAAFVSGARDPEDHCYFYGDSHVQFFYYAYLYVRAEGGTKLVFRGVSPNFKGMIRPWHFSESEGHRAQANLLWLFKNKTLVTFKETSEYGIPDEIVFSYEFKS